MKMTTGLPHRDHRRGVTLLMVVSIIVLFLLMGTAFLVLATQFRRSATLLSHVRERGDSARTLVKRAFLDLLREPSLDNSRSPLRGHSLLGDLYGYGFSRREVPAAALTVANAALGTWFVTLEAPYDQLRSDLDGSMNSLGGSSTFDGRGRYLTLTDFYDGNGLRLGDKLGVTGHVIGYEVIPPAPPVAQLYRFTVRFGWDDARRLPTKNFVSFDLHLNGRPFSGTGAGRYTVGGAVTDFRTPALDVEALKPNRATPDPALSPERTTGESRIQLSTAYLATTTAGTAGPNPDSTNEDYDAVDYQNMFLAAVRYEAGVPRVTPSFYRPELVRYWHRTGTPYTNFATTSLGQVPYSFHADRQTGTGGHFYLDTDADGIPQVNGGPGATIWDIDNDGDGVNDSIWMDIDLPIQTDLRGNVYKPLVAYHVLDMDGRLNVNFHGNQYHRDPTDNSVANAATRRQLGLHGFYGDGAAGNPNDGVLHPTGVGLGTGEISLHYALGQAATDKLFYGFDGVVGRYGSDEQVPAVGALGTDTAPGARGVIDSKANTRFTALNYPLNTFANGGLVNDARYRSPLDIHGRFELGVADYLLTVPQDPYTSTPTVSIAPGMPIINATASGLTPNELVDSVYEMDASQAPFAPRLGYALNTISAGQGLDANFSPRELEALLRAFDFDARQLPPRLRRFLPDVSSGANSQLRHLLTTDSWELPVAPQPLANLLRERWGRAATLDDLPAEAFLGRKLNLNGTTLTPRHLFTAALLVCPELINHDYNGDGAENANDQLAYRRDLAQWCVNVKDFMDPDSINTRVEFDLTPEAGWAPDVTIWGCERPELLLTESFALHDKRLEDRDDEVPNPPGDPQAKLSGTPADSDLDSRLVPNASAFIELYNPWVHSGTSVTSTNSDLPPADVYDATRAGVDLQKLNSGSPVWRLRILNSSTNTNANIDEQDINDNDEDVVKIVYFTEPGAAFLAARHQANPEVVFYPPAGLTTPALSPGRRAIIGSAGVVAGVRYTTYLGRRTDLAAPDDPSDPAWNQTRRIVLNPSASTVSTYYWNGTAIAAQTASNVVCVPIGRQYTFSGGAGGSKNRSLGLTDPKVGYDVASGVTLVDVPDGFRFPSTRDMPADEEFNATRWASIPTLPTVPPPSGGLKDEGKILSCFSVHLQRLADPTQPFDATTNPYLTVDYIGSDVSIFNGAYSGPDPDRVNTLAEDLASFERGRFHLRLGGNRERILWKGTQDGSLTVGTPRSAAGDLHVVSRDVTQSFGEVDLAYRTDASTHAFAWLTWNNRPYISQLELQNVPYTPQAQLTSRFDILAPTPDNPYAGVSSRVGTGPNSAFPHASDRFNHLFNFFADSVTSGAVGARQGLPALHRLFDYLHVESQFSGAEDRLPGKLNLNTIADERVWQGLMQQYGEASSVSNPYGALTWANFLLSRSPVVADPTTLPTEIPNLFRNADAVHRVPLEALLVRTSSATLLRGSAYGTTATTSLPLFESTTTTPRAWADPNRNAYFRYDIRQRLGNLVTNRSNVYAVWVTVGMFEVDPETLRPTNEVGEADGRVRRYRGFFLVDRSIPVAFEPGRDHNVENCVLVESIIQREPDSQR